MTATTDRDPAPAAPSASAAAAAWEARFRAPRTFWVRTAPKRPERGIVCTNATGVYQLHRWAVGEPLGDPITTAPTGRTFGWISADGEWVYWLQDEAGNEHGHFVAAPWAGGEPIDLTPDLPAYASFAADGGPDGTFATSVIGPDRVQIAAIPWLGDRPGSRPTLLDPGPGFVTNLVVGPGAIALSTTGGGGLSTRLRILDVESGEVRVDVSHAPGSITPIAYASTGRLLAQTDRSGQLRPLIVEPTGDVREVDPPGIAGSLASVAISDDGATAILLASHRTVEQLVLLDVERGTIRRLECVAGTFTSFSPSGGASLLPDGTAIITRENGTTLPEVLHVDVAADRVLRVLIPAPATPASQPCRSVDIPSTNGALVQGWLTTPIGDGPFPTILDVHGGPQAHESNRFYPGAQAWVDRGFAVLALNYRGSTGFGREYEQAIWGEVGRNELADMVAAREWLVRERIADPDRIVSEGGSYGGYLTLLALGARPELWAAGVALVAIADWRLLYEDGEALRDYQVALFEGTPEAQPELYAEASPVTYVDRLAAPLLVIQGRNDSRCPARQMEDYVARARAAGKALEIDWFDAGHGHGAIDMRIAWQRRSIEFVEAALGITNASPV
jgi:dipeptidyl aminopeptidase/acylaminoacyl peptidase